MEALSQIILIVQRALNKNDGCSAIIFSLVIIEMAFEIINNGKRRATFVHYFMEIFFLLFADNILVMTETVMGL